MPYLKSETEVAPSPTRAASRSRCLSAVGLISCTVCYQLSEELSPTRPYLGPVLTGLQMAAHRCGDVPRLTTSMKNCPVRIYLKSEKCSVVYIR